MKQGFIIRKTGAGLIIENPGHPKIRAEVGTENPRPDLRKIDILETSKISEIKKTIRKMKDFLQKHPEEIRINEFESCYDY